MKLSIKNRNYRILLVLLILLFLGGLSFFDYNFQTSKTTNENLNQTTMRVNENISLTFYNKLEDIELVLSSLAIQASNYNDIEDPSMMNVLKRQSISDNYLQLSITTAKGLTIYPTTMQVVDTSQEAFFKMVMQGETHISSVKTSIITNRPVIEISVPIWKDSIPIGVIRGSIDIEMFNEVLRLSITESNQDAILVEKNGNIIAKTPVINSTNFYERLRESTIEDKTTIANITTDFENHLQGSIHYTFKDKERLAYYSPIKDSEWTIVTIYPYDTISTQLNSKYKQTMQFLLRLSTMLGAALVFIIYFERRATKEIKSVNKQLDTVIDNTPGCLILYEYHNHKNIKFLNNEFVNICGYTKDEFKKRFDNDLFQVIQPDDLLTLREKIHQDVDNNDSNRSLSYTYRFIHKNGEFIWVIDRRHLVSDAHGKQWFYISLIDISELKSTQEKLRISQQHYQMIIEQTESVVFEWDVQKDIITFSDLFRDKFGYELEYHDFLIVTNRFFENKEDSYIPLLQAFICGELQGQIECRIRKKNGDYIWCKITAKAIKDSFGYLVNVFGSIEDINDMKSKTLMLEEKTKIDGLTKILNKITIENQIIETLHAHPNERHILFVIDVDDFKQINDTLGHAMGDKVLREIAAKIMSSFRSDDFVGRIGGDEFIAFIKNTSHANNDFIMQKICVLHEALSNIAIDGLLFNITCSIGVAIYPDQGASYEVLFNKADRALYKAKKDGKDTSCICE